MKLYEAIEYAINKEGIGIICEQRFTNYLADLQAYETPAVRCIVTIIMKDGYCEKLYDGLVNSTYNVDFKEVAYQLTHSVGFQEQIVQFVLDSLLYATHKIDDEPTFEYDSVTKINDQSQSNFIGTVITEQREIISKKDIENFFNLEAEAAKEKWEATMKLSIQDRIRKRKAIKDVYLDKEYSDTSEDH